MFQRSHVIGVPLTDDEKAQAVAKWRQAVADKRAAKEAYVTATNAYITASNTHDVAWEKMDLAVQSQRIAWDAVRDAFADDVVGLQGVIDQAKKEIEKEVQR